MITFEIDGKKVSAESGEMVIQAADKAGIYIPRFCYHKKLSIAANCRMCLVEVENVKKPLPACATPVAEDMKVFTQSEMARDAQKAIMEFLLINHPLDCPICDQGGECELQDISMGFGSGVSDYSEGKRAVKDENLGPLVGTEMTRCIHCTRCVRFGVEIAGMPELGATARGESMQIGTYVKHAMKSELSGNVIDLCPVGALTNKVFRFNGRAWEMRQHASISPHDCVGSNIYLHNKWHQYTDYRDVMRVVPCDNESVNENWISDRDRYSFQALSHDDRLTRPMIKMNGEWQEVDWLAALNFTVEKMGALIKAHGAHEIGALASPSATTEEHYLLQRLMRGIGTHNVDHRIRDNDFSQQQQAPAFPSLGVSLPELATQNAIFLIGSNIQKDEPLACHRVRQATLAGGRVMALNAIDYDFNFDVSDKLIAAPQHWVNELAAIANVLGAKYKGITPTDAHKAIVKTLKEQEAATIILGDSANQHSHATLIKGLVQFIAEKTGATVGQLTAGANSAGAWLAGAVPHREAAGALIAKPGLSAHEILTKQLKGLVLMGIEPELDCADAQAAMAALAAAEFVVALSSFKHSSLLEHADVILPSAPFSETSGTYVNVNGDWQSFQGATVPLEEVRPAWKILRVLGNLFDVPSFDYVSTDAIRRELQEKVQSMSALSSNWELPEALPEVKNELYRVADWPIYRADALVRRATALQQTMDGNFNDARMHPSTAASLNINADERVTLKQANSVIALPLILCERVAQGAVLVHSGMSYSAGFGRSFAPITVESGGQS